uniref:Uncharacterized protein n=1 Tax=Anguilla anguilla TaxID=7936 RepID=A0A0E9WW05_ANGAN
MHKSALGTFRIDINYTPHCGNCAEYIRCHKGMHTLIILCWCLAKTKHYKRRIKYQHTAVMLPSGQSLSGKHLTGWRPNVVTAHRLCLVNLYMLLSRCFYPKRHTVHEFIYFSVCVVPGDQTHNICIVSVLTALPSEP